MRRERGCGDEVVPPSEHAHNRGLGAGGSLIGAHEGSLLCDVIADEVGTTQSKYKSNDLLEE